MKPLGVASCGLTSSCVCVYQLLEDLCVLNNWAAPQYQAASTLHDGLPVYACRVSASTWQCYRGTWNSPFSLYQSHYRCV